MATAIKTASVLAFERKLDPSDALMYVGKWHSIDSSDGWEQIAVREKSVRGTISNRKKTKDQDPAKLEADIRNPNLQKVDVAALPPDSDTLKVWFTIKVLPGVGVPSACNHSDYQAQLAKSVNAYIDKYGVSELARRYAYNIANARFLWRNRLGSEKILVKISQVSDDKIVKTWSFNALELSLRNFASTGSQEEKLAELSKVIADGITGQDFVLLDVSAYALVGSGQEVFPSQELILDKSKNDKSRTLYQVGSVAALHSQKVGNAIRTIDTWYPDADEVGPIAIEPYGSVTTLGKAFRQPKEKTDFYTLLDRWICEGKDLSEDEQHFVIAMFIRGGVFGESEKE